MADVIDYGPTMELSDELTKAKPRGGRYYRRVRTGDPVKPWKYYYTKEAYEREHGDAAHLHGPEVAERRKESTMGSPMLIVSKKMGKSLFKGEGEGSRGGHVVGHTKSGKPIYGGGHEHYQGYTPTPDFKKKFEAEGYGKEEHKQARDFHIKSAVKAGSVGKSEDEKAHLAAATKHHNASGSTHHLGYRIKEFYDKSKKQSAARTERAESKKKLGVSKQAYALTQSAKTADEHKGAAEAHRKAAEQHTAGSVYHKMHTEQAEKHERKVKTHESTEKSMRFEKAGGERAGHKYLSRKKNGSGGYDYVYSHPKTGAHVGIHTVPGASLGGVTTRAFVAHHGLSAPSSALHTPSPEAHEEKNHSVKSPHPPGISHGKNHKGEQADEHEKGMLEHALRDTHPKHIKRENKNRAKWGKPPIDGEEVEKPKKKSSETPSNRADYEHAGTDTDAYERELARAQAKKSEGHIMDSVTSTPELRAAFRGLDGPKHLAKGLYKFESYGYAGPGGRHGDEKLPEEYLMVYLDAFIEEAFEHEKCEKMHTTDNALVGPGPASMGSTQGDEADFWAPFIMNELVVYAAKNKNLLRACEKHNCNAQYIADRLRDMNLVKPMASHATMHGDFMEAYMDSEKRTMDSVGKSLTRAGTVVSEEEMFKAIAHGQRLSEYAPKTVRLAEDDDPITSLRKFHEKRNDDIERVFYGDDKK